MRLTISQFRINFVTDNVEVMFSGDVRNGLYFCRPIRDTGGIAWIVKDNAFDFSIRICSDGGLNEFWGQNKVGFTRIHIKRRNVIQRQKRNVARINW